MFEPPRAHHFPIFPFKELPGKGLPKNCACALASKLFGETRLLQNCVGCVAGHNFVVHGEAPSGNWAVPDFVVPTAQTLKGAPMAAQDFFGSGRAWACSWPSGSQSNRAAFLMSVAHHKFH